MKDTKSKATLIALEALIALSLAFAIVFTVHAIARAQSRETPVYDANGRYQGSVFDYGRTQTYTDRNGPNGTTSFFNRNGQFSGSAGSSIDRAFNFNKR